MKTKVNQFKNIHLICAILFISFITFGSKTANAEDFKGWQHGASGYDKAMQSAVKKNAPLIVYFNTDWCGWCKKMNRDYIGAGSVKNFLADFPKVEINPDEGKRATLLRDKFGVTGFPAFFVSIPSLKTEADRVHPFGNSKNFTPTEFIASIKTKVGKQYGRKGFESFKAGKNDLARKHLDSAINYNPINPYFYYLKGHINYKEGYNTKNSKLLKEAEKEYLKALKINPNYKNAKNDLEKLRKTMEYLKI